MTRLQRFFEKTVSMNEIVIIWRQHPLPAGTVKAMRPQFIEQYQQLVDFLRASSRNLG